MRFPHKQLIVALAFSCALTNCGRAKTFDSVRVIHRGLHMQQQRVNVTSAASSAIKRRRDEQVMFLVAGIHAKEQPVQEPSSVTPSPVIPPTVTVPATSIWDCIAEAETGSDYAMHGATYSTAFGVINDIVYQYGTSEEQQAVFSGTASRQQQVDIASRFAADHGFGGWGELTKQKCGL